MSFELNRAITLTPVSGAVEQLRFVELTNTGEVQQVSSSGGDSVGVSLEASADTSQVAIPVSPIDGGKIPVIAGAPVALGVRIMSDNQGRAITATGATARVLGISLESSAAAGEQITILAQKAAGEFVA